MAAAGPRHAQTAVLRRGRRGTELRPRRPASAHRAAGAVPPDPVVRGRTRGAVVRARLARHCAHRRGKAVTRGCRFLLAESKASAAEAVSGRAPDGDGNCGRHARLAGNGRGAAFEADDPSRRAVVVQVGWTDQVEWSTAARSTWCTRGADRPPRARHRAAARRASGSGSTRRRPAGDEAVAAAGRFGVRRLFQDPGTLPEWYAIATPKLAARACGRPLTPLKRSWNSLPHRRGSWCCHARRPRSTAGRCAGRSGRGPRAQPRHPDLGCGDGQPAARRVRRRGARVPGPDHLTQRAAEVGCRSLAAISPSSATTTPNVKYSAGSHGATPNSASESSA